MHFDHFTIFIDESNNVFLKKKLMNFQKKLKTIIDIFNIICDRQRNNYIVVFEIVKKRLNHKFRKIIYRNVEIYVTSFALKKIDDQYKKLLKTKKKTSINLFVRNLSKKSWIFFVRTSSKNVERILKMKKYWNWSIYIRIENSKNLFVITMNLTNSWTLTTTKMIHLFKIFCYKYKIQQRYSRKIVFENHKIETKSKQQKNEIVQKNDSEFLTISFVENFRDSNILKSLILFRTYKFFLINFFLVNFFLCDLFHFNLFDRLFFISNFRCLIRFSLHIFSKNLSSIFRFRFNRFQIKCTINDSIKCTINSFRLKITQQQREQNEIKAKKQTEKTQNEWKNKKKISKILSFEFCEINIAIIHCCKNFEFERIDFFVIISISLIECNNVFSMRIDLMNTW